MGKEGAEEKFVERGKEGGGGLPVQRPFRAAGVHWALCRQHHCPHASLPGGNDHLISEDPTRNVVGLGLPARAEPTG